MKLQAHSYIICLAFVASIAALAVTFTFFDLPWVPTMEKVVSASLQIISFFLPISSIIFENTPLCECILLGCSWGNEVGKQAKITITCVEIENCLTLLQKQLYWMSHDAVYKINVSVASCCLFALAASTVNMVRQCLHCHEKVKTGEQIW